MERPTKEQFERALFALDCGDLNIYDGNAPTRVFDIIEAEVRALQALLGESRHEDPSGVAMELEELRASNARLRAELERERTLGDKTLAALKRVEALLTEADDGEDCRVDVDLLRAALRGGS